MFWKLKKGREKESEIKIYIHFLLFLFISQKQRSDEERVKRIGISERGERARTSETWDFGIFLKEIVGRTAISEALEQSIS